MFQKYEVEHKTNDDDNNDEYVRRPKSTRTIKVKYDACVYCTNPWHWAFQHNREKRAVHRKAKTIRISFLAIINPKYQFRDYDPQTMLTIQLGDTLFKVIISIR